MDTYDPATVFSSIDHQGRYAYANQPRIATWNLARLAETLLPLLDDDQQKAVAQAEEVLAGFSANFEAAFLAGMRKKLGLFSAEEEDGELAREFLSLLAASEADFTVAFRRLSNSAGDPATDEPVRSLFEDANAYETWAARWHRRLAKERQDLSSRRAMMRAVNPAFIPRNHRVEGIIQAAVQRDDFAPFEELLSVLSKPFEDQPGLAHYMSPPQAHERVCQTFCGT
jgi:uncharacterized protein YdiU (UPF0061 family)